MTGVTRTLGWCGFVALGLAAAACDEGPTGLDGGVNLALLEEGGDMGFATAQAPSLPQGQASLDGPGGMALDATAEEFVQQLTLGDGRVLKTSGIYARAVPDESVTGAPFIRISAGSALTGSLDSVEPGSYTIEGAWPDIDFIDVVPVTYGTVQEAPGPTTIRASSGTFVISSLSYFPEVYPCETPVLSAVTIEECRFQLGVISGSFSLTATLSSGELVQGPTDFTLPIRRRTMVGRQH